MTKKGTHRVLIKIGTNSLSIGYSMRRGNTLHRQSADEFICPAHVQA